VTEPIEVLFWPTPNGMKIAIMLEELGVPYTATPVDIGKDEQFSPDFLRHSPNNKIPAIVDAEGPDGQPVSIFESGAILMYLGRKFGRLYAERGERARIAVEEWLVWQVAGFGPMLGQLGHFKGAKETIPYALKRYGDEAKRLYGVLEKRLEGRDYVADDFSIADIAIYPWTRNWHRHDIDPATHPNVVAWRERMAARPAVAAAYARHTK
jgi:GST-like protein